ncbi:MAG: hypothetical protein KTR21_03585 [Rhodobacteraceae bacterium]|nr:hypothetical protein [Paracoccaceae bacterium]
MSPTGSISFDDLDAYVGAACEGLGVVQVLWFQAKRAIDRGDLIPILPDHSCSPVQVSALVAERRHIPRRTRGVLDWLQNVLKAAELKSMGLN